MQTQEAGAGTIDLVAELEAQFGDKLTKARADYQENQSDRQKLDTKRAALATKKTKMEANRKECLIQHGKGVKGAAVRRQEAEQELDAINGEIEAVDAAIAYEAERTSTLHAQLTEMEAKLAEAKKRQVQNEFAGALKDKKEEFIESFVASCVLLGEMVMISNDLIGAEGHVLYEQVMEDLILRTSRVLLIDNHKFTEAYSGLSLARRVFEVTALVPPPDADNAG